MPKDERTAPVEKFRLTKEQMVFQKRMGTLRQIQELLQARSLLAAGEMKDLRELWRRLEGEFQTLEVPAEPVRELEGMEFEEPEMRGFTREEEAPTESTPGFDWRLSY